MAADAPPSRLTELRTSARGWQGVQLAVLGFIGLCGVLTQQDKEAPHGVQAIAAVLALVALALACAATFLVGRAAWPLYRAGGLADEGPRELDRAAHALSRGLALTFVAVALTALSAASGWWPTHKGAPSGEVRLQAQGQTVCGTLVAGARQGTVDVRTAAGTVEVPLQALSGLEPVGSCS